MAPLLELNDVSARYGQVAALHGISLTVDEGEIVALLGANGAGKTTTLRAVSGTGVAHVPEGRGIFSELTVWENLRMGAYMRRGRPDFKTVLDYCPWLDARRHQHAGTLSGGEQQMLALALAPLVAREVFRVVGDLNEKEGLAGLVVEQNAVIALAAARRAYVLETGSIAMSGSADELRSNDAVRSAYLGY